MDERRLILNSDAVPLLGVSLQELNDQIAEQVQFIARAGRTIEEARCRAAIVQRLPRTGAWLCEHPRILGLVFRARPSLRPTLVYRDGRLIGEVA